MRLRGRPDKASAIYCQPSERNNLRRPFIFTREDFDPAFSRVEIRRDFVAENQPGRNRPNVASMILYQIINLMLAPNAIGAAQGRTDFLKTWEASITRDKESAIRPRPYAARGVCPQGVNRSVAEVGLNDRAGIVLAVQLYEATRGGNPNITGGGILDDVSYCAARADARQRCMALALCQRVWAQSERRWKAKQANISDADPECLAKIAINSGHDRKITRIAK